MADRKHLIETIAFIDPTHGYLRHIIAPADNSSCILIYEDKGQCMTLTKDGHVLYKSEDAYDPPMFALSLDGKTLALAPRFGRGGVIELNGKVAYKVPEGFHVSRLEWLGKDLAWSGWFEDEHGSPRQDVERPVRIKTFMNGDDVTGRLDFEPMIGERGQGIVVVRTSGMRYVVHDDGSHSEPVSEVGDEDVFRHPSFYDRSERPEERHDETGRLVRVVYRGKEGPVFDALENGSGLRTYAFNADRSRVAYVGIRYPAIVRNISNAAVPVFERIEDAENKKGRSLWRLLQWPVALLFNPYFGPGLAAIESSKRYIPVDDGRPWKKGYRFANDQFYTPNDELVVTAWSRRGPCVAIDEDEGPEFDRITNVRWLPKERTVSYLAVSENTVNRVVMVS